MGQDNETRPPPPEPTDAEVAAYVAENCADLARLSQRPGFQTVRCLLGLARLEAEKLAKAGERGTR